LNGSEATSECLRSSMFAPRSFSNCGSAVNASLANEKAECKMIPFNYS
jgi:hypothetical protein